MRADSGLGLGGRFAGKQPSQDPAGYLIGHGENALNVVALDLVGEEDLSGGGFLNLEVQAEARAELQQRAAQEQVGARFLRHILGLAGRQPLSLLDAPPDQAAHALARDDVQPFGLRQVGGQQFGHAAAQPIERGVLRHVLDLDHSQHSPRSGRGRLARKSRTATSRSALR